MATEKVKITTYTRTLAGSLLQTVKWANLQFEMMTNSTLNERFNVQSGVAPDAGDIPAMRYLVIGNLGHTFVVGKSKSQVPVTLPHGTNDAACYNHIPFAIRDVGDDFTAERRKRYCLRVIETIDNKERIVYYGRRIDTSLTKASVNVVTTKDGEVTSSPYTYSTDDLKPKPPSYSTSGQTVGSDVSYMATAVFKIELDADDIAEIINANSILEGQLLPACISEIGLCTGVDKTVALPETSGSYSEVIACQVNLFVGTFHAVGYASDGLTLTIDAGTGEPKMADGTNTNG